MAGELHCPGQSVGLTVKALIRGPNRRYRWNGTAMVLSNTITDVDWATGMIVCAEELSSDSTGSGDYIGSFPSAITAAGSYAIQFYLDPVAVGDVPICIQEIWWDGAKAIAIDQVRLDAAGFAAVEESVPTGVPTSNKLGARIQWLIQRMWSSKQTKTSATQATIEVRDDANQTISSQQFTDDGTTQDMEKPS